MPVLSAIKRTRLAQKRPRDHAPDFVFAVEYATRDLTQLVKTFERNHLFMRGDLKHRVRGCVNDRFACVDVLLAEHFDDLSSRSRYVAEYAGHIGFAHKAIDDHRRKAFRIRRKRAFENDAGHFPMTRCRVLAVRTQRTTAIRTGRILKRRQLRQRTNIAESVTLEIRQVHFPRLEYVSDSVRACVAPLGSIRHRADSGAVENDQEDTVEGAWHLDGYCFGA